MGKSTILRLLSGFGIPPVGEIRINGIPLQQISLAELRQRIAVLEQDTFLSTEPLPKHCPGKARRLSRGNWPGSPAGWNP